MEKMITYDHLRYFAYSNDHICKRPIKGIVMDFWGMDSYGIIKEDSDTAKFYAEQGILFLIPYYNPWAFCNRQTVAYIEEILDVVHDRLVLPAELPLVYTGNSMGGLTALACTVLCKHKAIACLANCPVCDMGNHIYERDDLPHSLYSAFGTYDGTLEEAVLTVSPLHLVDKMPDIPYYVFCGEEDKIVSKKIHSDRFVEEMKKTHRITYYEIPEMGHCNLPEEMKLRYREIAANAILNN